VGKVLAMVMGDEDAAELSKKIGARLQMEFNGGHAPAGHLRMDVAGEKLKVIPVAVLPDVPGIFQWLFRRGFKKESERLSIILDWDGQLAKSCGYSSGVVIALKLPNVDRIETYSVTSEDDAIKRIRGHLTASR
jgi:hypothetical protein